MADTPHEPDSKSYLYHSFVRAQKNEPEEATLSRGLKVLSSILDNGLLLTPERFDFEEGRSDGSMRALWVCQTRVCFTLIEPRQLPKHTKTFGSITLEWEVDLLQKEGALPVAYLPVYGTDATIGASLLARLYEAQASFKRLEDLKRHATTQKSMSLQSSNNAPRPLDIPTVLALISFLEEDAVEIEDQFASLRTIAGYFLPMYNPKHSDDILNYYRQREWRITQMWLRRGAEITPKCTDEQKQQLLAINEPFFSKNIVMLNAEAPRVEFCNYLPKISGEKVASTIRRIIAPSRFLSEIDHLLQVRKLQTATCAIESLS